MTPATNWKEIIHPGEEARFEDDARFLLGLQAKHAVLGAKQRALHAKPHLGLTAELTVLDGLPAFAQVGPFATPGTFKAYVRFSNGDPAHRKDTVADVRGLALKLVGVGGRKVIPGLEDAKTQDILFILSPSFSFKNADEFMGFVRAMQSPATALFKLLGLFGWGAFALVKKLKAGVGVPVPTLAARRFYTAVPCRFGDSAAKFDLVPSTAPVEGPTPPSLRDELAARLAKAPVSWTLRAQFFVDEARTPIEDASRAWPEDVSPYVPLATLTLPQQDASTARGQALGAWVEKLSFDPWHAPVEFRPLGHVMRARNVAYRESTKARGVAPEPDGSETFG